jgi:MerR family copper efflux transcriptional regulator
LQSAVVPFYFFKLLEDQGGLVALTIGQAASRSGCTTPTIRYYEEIGLLPPVGRTGNGRRAYGWPQVHRLTFIRRARDLGLSIGQVRDLLGVTDGDPANCGEARDLIQVHIKAIRQKRNELEGLERILTSMAARCGATCATDPSETCTIFADFLAVPQAMEA